VMCLGDSRTFGVWASQRNIQFNNDYPAVLQRRISASRPQGGKPVEVINAGVIGYTAAHGLRQFITQGLDLSPSVIVIALGFNDILYSWDPALGLMSPDRAVQGACSMPFTDFAYFRWGCRFIINGAPVSLGPIRYYGINPKNIAGIWCAWSKLRAANIFGFCSLSRGSETSPSEPVWGQRVSPQV